MTATPLYRVKVKLTGESHAKWLASGGRTTRLLVHAAQMHLNTAQVVASDLTESNPDVVEWARPEAIA